MGNDGLMGIETLTMMTWIVFQNCKKKKKKKKKIEIHVDIMQVIPQLVCAFIFTII